MTKIQIEETINEADRSTYPDEKSVLRSEATRDIATQTHLRCTVVQAVRGGMRQTGASNVFGVSLRAVSKWMALDQAGGLRALKQKARGRRVGEGRLQAAQLARIRQLIIERISNCRFHF